MKLLLINPYFGDAKSRESEGSTYHPPLGLGFIGTYVRDNTKCKVEIIDPVPQGLTKDNVLEKVSIADFVGLACYSATRFSCFDFAKKIKERNPSCKLIIGGPHVYFLDGLILKHYPFVDIIVRGEGEETVVDIINGKPCKDIKGITWRDSDGIIIRNPDRDFIKNIDNLYVDYTLLPDLSLYKPDIEAPVDLKRLKTVSLIESRGCPYHCIYCANDHWRRSWRSVSPRKTVEKMEYLVKTLGIEYFRFYDDLFTFDEKRVFEFCRALKEKKLNIKFRVLCRVGTSREVLEALKEVGCESVGLGIESGSDKILKRIKKGINRQQIIDTIKICNELKILTIGSFMVSLPDETMEDFKETLELIHIPGLSDVYIFQLLSGTPFYNELKARGEINDEIWFDRTKFEGAIFYSKENFTSARFSINEAKWLVLYAKYYNFVHYPSKAIIRYGTLLGLFIIMLALIDTPLKGKLFFNFVFKYRNIYRKFTMNVGKKQNYSLIRATEEDAITY